jgi:hypothetical protein
MLSAFPDTSAILGVFAAGSRKQGESDSLLQTPKIDCHSGHSCFAFNSLQAALAENGMNSRSRGKNVTSLFSKHLALARRMLSKRHGRRGGGKKGAEKWTSR